jgi:hypothetical protein
MIKQETMKPGTWHEAGFLAFWLPNSSPAFSGFHGFLLKP